MTDPDLMAWEPTHTILWDHGNGSTRIPFRADDHSQGTVDHDGMVLLMLAELRASSTWTDGEPFGLVSDLITREACQRYTIPVWEVADIISPDTAGAVPYFAPITCTGCASYRFDRTARGTFTIEQEFDGNTDELTDGRMEDTTESADPWFCANPTCWFHDHDLPAEVQNAIENVLTGSDASTSPSPEEEPANAAHNP